MPRDILIKRHKPRRVRIPVNGQPRRSEADHFLELDRFISQVEHRIEINQIGSIPSSDSSYATTSSSSSRSEGTYAQFCSPISDDSRSSRRRKVSYKTKFTEHLNFSDSDFDAVLFEAAVNDCYPPEKRRFTIKLRVNGEPPSKPKRLCLVGEIPKGCEDIVEGLREDPENTYLLAELRKRGFKAIADPLKPGSGKTRNGKKYKIRL
ncbi:hypothetical protein DFP73DRAFT_524707 [Morchella snyderi]|nr:hypothetical protein DFP73DRAFT_524707 [Morchella snyderi]